MKPYPPCPDLEPKDAYNEGRAWETAQMAYAAKLFSEGHTLEHLCSGFGRQPEEILHILWYQDKLVRKLINKPAGDKTVEYDYFVKESRGEMDESDLADADNFVEASLDSKEPVTYTLEMVEDLLLSSWITGEPIKDGPLLRKIVQQRLEK